MVVSALEDMYTPAFTRLPENWNTFERFMVLLNDLDNTSSPGIPYMKTASTIGKWLGADGLGNFNPMRVKQLWFDVQRVINEDFDHVFRAFVKDEPHKISKAKEHRWRLIIASSLPVQMVWRMLYYHQNESLNKNSYQIPSKHGTTFCYGGWKRFLADCESNNLKISRDISGWDVNAPGWVFEVIRRWRARWPGVTLEWNRVHNMMYDDAYKNSEIQFSNGIVVKQLYDGFMKSGLYNTISDNSVAMVAVHVLACVRSRLGFGRIGVTGDDVVQSLISDQYLEEVGKLGCKVKEVIHHLEFMGTNYENGYPEPLYFEKHLTNLKFKEGIEEEVLDAYLRLYSYSPRFDFWKRVAELGGWKSRSRGFYKFWYDSPLAAQLHRLW